MHYGERTIWRKIAQILYHCKTVSLKMRLWSSVEQREFLEMENLPQIRLFITSFKLQIVQTMKSNDYAILCMVFSSISFYTILRFSVGNSVHLSVHNYVTSAVCICRIPGFLRHPIVSRCWRFRPGDRMTQITSLHWYITSSHKIYRNIFRKISFHVFLGLNIIRLLILFYCAPRDIVIHASSKSFHFDMDARFQAGI
jgi:hypothetical protein